MLERLVRAAGCDLEMSVRAGPPTPTGLPLDGPVGRELIRRRHELRAILARHGLSNPRVFGSVARAEETAASDVDLLVDVAPGVGLMGLARCERDLQGLLGVPVDLVPADHVKPAVAASVFAEARPL